MADYKVGEVIKCLKIFLETKDFASDVVPCENESTCDVTIQRCSCHGSLTKNGNLDVILKKKIRYFMLQTEHLKMKNFIINQGTSMFLTDCICFGSKNELFQPSGCTCDTAWQVVILCLKTMLALNQSLCHAEDDESRDNNQAHLPNIIGVNDQETICSVIEMIISFGVFPNLLPGVGRPLKSNTNLHTLLPEKSKISPRKLLIITNVMMEMLKTKTLHSIMVSRNLNDMVASLIQLCYCPTKCYDSTVTVISQCCCVNETTFKGCSNCSNLCQHERKWCNIKLDCILTSTYQPFVIKELLVLQRCSILNKKSNNKWFLKVIGHKLSKCIIRDNGVKYVIEGILAGCSSDSMNWQKYKSVGKLIAHVPAQVSTAEDYYKLVSPQLIKFLEKGEAPKGSASSQYLMVTVACIEEMLELNYNLTEEYIFKSLLHPLKTSFSPNGIVELYSDSISKCVLSMQLLCSIGIDLSEKFMKILSEVLHPLFVVLCLYQEGDFRKSLHSLVVYLLNHIDPIECIKWLNLFLFNDKLLSGSETDSRSSNMNLTDREAQFITNICGQVDHVSVDNVATEVKVKALLSLVKDKKLEDVRGDFFVGLLGKLTRVLQCDTKKEEKNEKGNNSQELKEIDNKISDIQQKIQLVSIISALIDTFEYKILQNTPQTVTFIKGILDLPWKKKKESCLFDIDDDFHEETVDLVLMLISFLLKTEKLTSSDFVILNTLAPSLEKASNNHSKESSRSLANDLKVYIATRGAVTTERVPQSGAEPKEIDLTSREAYEGALRDLTDPLLPTRGHALFQLSKLLKYRNKYAMKDQKKLLNIFETNLAHHDTYLYLAAIEGLLFLVDVHHKDVLPLLCRKFAQFQDEDEVTLSSELRMKIGEAIVKSCRLIGNMLPVYSQLLLSALLTGVKDNDHLVRASSLSAIGDVCQLSKFSISSISIEIVSCIHHVVSSDKSVEVRRAAIQVFTLMFKGIGSRMLQDIPDTIRDIYHILKDVLAIDDDALTQLHASNALDILDDVVRDTLFAKPKLEKKIQILG